MLLVSPHCDDAALSCSALLERREPVDVLTVFGGSPEPPRRGYWDERCGFADSAEAVRVRREEELRALAGHRVTFLELLEDQYLDGPRAPADASVIEQAVARWTGLVAAPAAAGRTGRLARLRRSWVPQHPDHVFVRDAVLRAAHGPVLLYEEFPYARTGTGRGPRGAQLLVLPVDRVAKARRISAYVSQLPYLGSPDEAFDRPEALPDEERYWRLG